jgi:hypothetical protein
MRRISFTLLLILPNTGQGKVETQAINLISGSVYFALSSIPLLLDLYEDSYKITLFVFFCLSHSTKL